MLFQTVAKKKGSFYYNPQFSVSNEVIQAQGKLEQIKQEIKKQNDTAHKNIITLLPTFQKSLSPFSTLQWLKHQLIDYCNQVVSEQVPFNFLELLKKIEGCHRDYSDYSSEKFQYVLGEKWQDKKNELLEILKNQMMQIKDTKEFNTLTILQEDYERQEEELRSAKEKMQESAKKACILELQKAFDSIKQEAEQAFGKDKNFHPGMRGLCDELKSSLQGKKKIYFDDIVKGFRTLEGWENNSKAAYLIGKIKEIIAAHQANIDLVMHRPNEFEAMFISKTENNRTSSTTSSLHAEDDKYSHPLASTSDVVPETLQDLITKRKLDLSIKENREHWSKQVSWWGGVELPYKFDDPEKYKVPHAIAEMYAAIYSKKNNSQEINDGQLLQRFQTAIETSNNRYKLFNPTRFGVRKEESIQEKTYREINQFQIPASKNSR